MRFVVAFLFVGLAVPVLAQPPIVSQPGVTVALPPPVPAPEPDLPELDLEAELRQIEAEIDLLSEGIPAEGGANAWPDLESVAALPPIRSLVHPPDRSIPLITNTLRHTVIQLPPEESIVDFVVGDSYYFDLRGGDNVAVLKAMEDGRRTQVTLLTTFDHAYSFDVFSTMAYRPDQVLTVSWTAEEGGNGGTVSGFNPRTVELDFRPASLIEDFRGRIARAEADAFRIREEAASEEAQIRDLGFQRFQEYLDAYPTRVQHRYRLSDDIRRAPLFINQIWTDGQFTYLRSRSQESPAIYSLSGKQGEEPVLVNVALRPEGLYVVDHVLSAGFAQLQGVRGDWYLWDVPPVDLLADLPLPRGDGGPEWVRTRRSLPWIKRHPKIFGALIAGGIGGYVTLKAVL